MAKEEKNPIRKEGRTRGTITQKPMAFRCDIENIDWLQRQPNKGRYINELIRKDREASAEHE